MAKWHVLLTDYAWPDVSVERDLLAEADAELRVALSTDEATLARLAADADAIMTCWAPVTGDVIRHATRCRIIARLGIGLDNIDVDEASQRGIAVTNVPDYCVTEVAEHALALLLALARKVAFYHLQTKSGRYDLPSGLPMWRISGRRLGIVGFGQIGRALARKAAALELEVLATGRTRPASLDGARWCDFEELLTQSDYVSLHVPLVPETRHMIGSRELSLMKSTAFLINTARGGLIDHAALAAALSAGEIAGVALDVQEPEPPALGQPPWNDPRVIVTPHTAFASVESIQDLRHRATNQVISMLRGDAVPHVVNSASLGQGDQAARRKGG